MATVNGRFVFLLCLASFYSGFLISSWTAPFGYAIQQQQPQQPQTFETNEKHHQDYRKKIEILNGLLSTCRQQQQQNKKRDKQQQKNEPTMFTNRVSGFMVGASRVSKDELLDKFDPGIPRWSEVEYDTPPGERDALLFYSHEDAMPTEVLQDNFDRLDVEEAISNCKTVELIMRHDPPEHHTCFAIVGNQESRFTPNVYRWFISNDNNDDDDDDAASVVFEPTGRGREEYTEEDDFPLPEHDVLMKHRKRLAAYLDIVDSVLVPFVRPILDAVVQKERRDLIVTSMNAGVADLLQNFVCSCRAKDIHLSFVVFCIDQESVGIAEGLGLTAIYHPDLFGAVTSQASQAFGDEAFVAVNYAKVFVSHLLSIMGYSFLYQDVDIVWYQDPLEYLKQNGYIDKFDLLFQDDGDRPALHAPYFANAGFYYANNNAKTQFFFRQLLYNADNIPKWFDQPVMSALLPEAASVFGMTIKTLPQKDFLGGQFYQFSSPIMKEILTKRHLPVMFHMHFTVNKPQKILQMKQTGMWYLKQIGGRGSSEYQCSPEPVIECVHFDRPSVPECRNAQGMTQIEEHDEYSRRFWTSDDD
jgi:hypothetical protein